MVDVAVDVEDIEVEVAVAEPMIKSVTVFVSRMR